MEVPLQVSSRVFLEEEVDNWQLPCSENNIDSSVQLPTDIRNPDWSCLYGDEGECPVGAYWHRPADVPVFGRSNFRCIDHGLPLTAPN